MVASRRHALKRQTALIGGLVVALVALASALRANTAEPPGFHGRVPESVETSAGPLPSALFVGDDFAAGVGAQGGDAGYACLAARQMNWLCNLDAQAGTGYVANGAGNSPDFRAFADRLASDRERYLADVIVVDGGRADSDVPVDTVAAAAASYLSALRAAWPDAVLVVLVPFRMGVTPRDYPFGVALGNLLREVVRPYNGVVIDGLAEQWVPPERAPSLLYSDGIHPNEAGHAHLAMRLVADLKNAGLADLQARDQPPS